MPVPAASLAVVTGAPAATTPPPARDRLLSAAKTVFVRDGLQGATTRAIAQEAGVNEVTLFRLFQSKERLLAAVMAAIVQHQQQRTALVDEERAWSGSLKPNLRRYADQFYAMLVQEEALIRTMIGEGLRYPDHAKQIIMEAAKPEHTRFVSNLEAARKAGQIRRGVDLNIAADVFTGMLISGMLRRNGDCGEEYTPEEYVAMCVNLFAASLAPPTA